MATMTIAEAGRVYDIVSEALQDTSYPRHAVSTLKGYDIIQIDIALKLTLANEFLLLSKTRGREEFEKLFEDGVQMYEAIPQLVLMTFVSDDEVNDYSARCAFHGMAKEYLSQETIGSFADYCRYVGADSPFYWPLIYQRLRLDHTPSSPQKNGIVFPTSSPGQPASISEHQQCNQPFVPATMRDAWKELTTLLRAMVRVFPSECRKLFTETREGRGLIGCLIICAIVVVCQLVWQLLVWAYSFVGALTDVS